MGACGSQIDVAKDKHHLQQMDKMRTSLEDVLMEHHKMERVQREKERRGKRQDSKRRKEGKV